MRHPRWQAWLLAGASSIMLGASGCSSVRSPFGRPEVKPGVRTITTVGGSPETVIAGMPGESHSGGPLVTEVRGRSTGRISGRVVDSRGRPIAGAEVRLADGPRSIERDSRVRTDDAGGFTLSGLRPGNRYTLIAQDSAQRSLVGRATAEAPDSSLEIVLRPSSRLVGQASNTREIDQHIGEDSEDDILYSSGDNRSRPRINHDDLPEVDGDAESNPLDDSRATTRATGDSWRSVSSFESVPQAPARPRNDGDLFNDRSYSAMGLPIEEDDGPNPLPPALERDPALAGQGSEAERGPGNAASRSLGPGAPSDSEVSAAETFTAGEGPLTAEFPTTSTPPTEETPTETAPNATPGSGPAPVESTPAPAETPSIDPGPVIDSITLPAPSRTGDEIEPEERATEPEPELIGLPSAPASESIIETPSTMTPDWPEATRPTSEAQEPAPAPGAEPLKSESPPHQPPPVTLETPDRPSWSQLTQQTLAQNTLIYPRSVRRAGSRPERPAPGANTGSSTASRRAPPQSETPRATCSFDARKKRLVDFELPDLGGNAVRFSDIDADYVLIDFWGTWCKPCVNSIPHLVELQNRYDPSRLRVVGIAYEEGPQDKRAQLVRSAAADLGINYPLLLGEQDGRPCPLQEALNIHQFPTMVLLDRHGRILWRDSGSNPATLERLDRVVASNTRATAEIVRR
jgi:thiol-disulfide isomerase/thioredoxin